MNHPFTQLVLCRIREFFREPEALFWVYAFPLILALVLGFAFSNSTPESPVVDVHAGPDAEALAKLLIDKGVKAKVVSEKEATTRLKKGKTALVVRSEAGTLKYIFDPARAEAVLARHWVDAVLVRGQGTGVPPFKDDPVSERGSLYIDFLMPGLVGMNIMGGGLFGVGFVLVDMRVRKLFKRLMATPMRHSEFLASLLVARLLFLLPEMGSLLLVANWYFGVPIEGSLVLLLLVILLGSFAFSGIGLLLGSRTEKTETMSGLVNVVMLPSYLLSGIFFSSKNYPEVAQPFIQALPLTQLNDALREVMLEGAGLFEADGTSLNWVLLNRLIILALWGSVTFLVAMKLFKWR